MIIVLPIVFFRISLGWHISLLYNASTFLGIVRTFRWLWNLIIYCQYDYPALAFGTIGSKMCGISLLLRIQSVSFHDMTQKCKRKQLWLTSTYSLTSKSLHQAYIPAEPLASAISHRNRRRTPSGSSPRLILVLSPSSTSTCIRIERRLLNNSSSGELPEVTTHFARFLKRFR